MRAILYFSNLVYPPHRLTIDLHMNPHFLTLNNIIMLLLGVYMLLSNGTYGSSTTTMHTSMLLSSTSNY